MTDILEYLSRDHRVTFETIDQIRMIPRSGLSSQEQLRASLRFREAEVVLCKRVRVHVTALTQLANQINDMVERGHDQKDTNTARKRFDGVYGISHLTSSTRQQAHARKSMADVAPKLEALARAVDDFTEDEYKFEHCLDYYIKLDKMLSELMRMDSLISDRVKTPQTCRLESSSTFCHAATDFISAVSGPLEQVTQNIMNELGLRHAIVQRLNSPPAAIRVIKRQDQCVQANPRLRALCDKLRGDLESPATHWEFPLNDVCSRLKKFRPESMSLGPLLCISLHRRADSFDHEMVLIEFGGGTLSPAWMRVERSAHWIQFGYDGSSPYDCVARAWTEDSMVFSCDHDYLSQSSCYVEVCIARYWPNGQSMHLDEVGDVICGVAKQKRSPELLEDDCRTFARRVFHRMVDAGPGAPNSVTWRGRRCPIEDVLSSIHRYPWYTPGASSRNLQSGESQVSILLEIACLQLLRDQSFGAKLVMEAGIDIATADQHSRHFLPECFWVLSHAYHVLGDPTVALEFAVKAYNSSHPSARAGDFGVWFALCKSVVNPASNIQGALLESLGILRHRSEETGYLEDKTAYIRCLCVLSDLYRNESEELFQQTQYMGDCQPAAARATEYGEEALMLAQDAYTPYLILSRLSIARAYVSLAKADHDGYNHPLFFIREANSVLGINEGRAWTIEVELVADAASLHGRIAAAASSEQGDDVSLLMEAITALDYGIRHCQVRGIRKDAIADLIRFHHDINMAIGRQGGKDLVVQERRRADNLVWRGLGFLSKLLPRRQK